MGNIAGEVLFYGLLISDCILFVAIGLFSLCMRKRSLVAVVIAGIFVLFAGFIGGYLMPLARECFYTLPTDDVDDIRLMHQCRVLSLIWMFAFAAAIAYFVRVIQKWRLHKGSQDAA